MIAWWMRLTLMIASQHCRGALCCSITCCPSYQSTGRQRCSYGELILCRHLLILLTAALFFSIYYRHRSVLEIIYRGENCSFYSIHNYCSLPNLVIIICFHAVLGLFTMNASMPQGYFWTEFSLQYAILVVHAIQEI